MARYLLLDNFFGPLVVAVTKMIKLVFNFLVIFVIGIFSYGVVQDRSYILNVIYFYAKNNICKIFVSIYFGQSGTR